jgi:hypothetical protein
MRRQEFRRVATFRYPFDLPEPCRPICLAGPKARVAQWVAPLVGFVPFAVLILPAGGDG